MQPRKIGLIIASVIAALTAPALAGNWVVTGSAHVSANDPPAGAANPADLTYNQVLASGANTNIWVPNPPVAEANWNNDNWVNGGQLSWARALSAPTEAEAKAKSGISGANDTLVADARARVLDVVDGNLANNGGDNNAFAKGVASVMPQLQVIINGPIGGPVTASCSSTVYMAGSPIYMAPYTASTTNPVLLPVGTVFTLGLTVTAQAQYPQLVLVGVIPGSYVGYNLMVNGSTASQGSAMYLDEGTSDMPTATDGFSGMVFTPWTPDSENQQFYEGNFASYYGALSTSLSLPAGYSFQLVPEPASAGLVVIGILALLRRRR